MKAALLAGRSEKPPAPPPVAKIDTVEVLAAKGDILMGQVLTAADMDWQTWPASAAASVFITKSDNPDAIEKLAGSIARTQFAPGEPLREAKLIKGNGSGFLAAMLPSGMRAVSTEITAETSAGGFILPNDHVDVILIQRKRGRTGTDEYIADTLFRNVRVLAIGQLIEAKDGKKGAEGNTATLELTPRQSELLALANSMGEISLALRSVADLDTKQEAVSGNGLQASQTRGNSVRVLRYGAKSRAYGVN